MFPIFKVMRSRKVYEKALELLQGKSLDGVIHLVGSLTLRPPHALSKGSL